MLYKLLVNGTAPELYPVETLFGLLYYSENDALEITKQYPFQGGWEPIPKNIHFLEYTEYPMPVKIDIAWISIIEQKAYSVEALLPTSKMQICWKAFAKDERNDFGYITVGMAPNGGMAVWIYSNTKSFLVSWIKADPFNVNEEHFKLLNNGSTPQQVCFDYINSAPAVRSNLEKNGLPPRDLFDNYMKQFTYRYQVMFGHWDEESQTWNAYTEEEKEKQQLPELDFIEEALFDGTHDKLHDGGLMKYHEAGKPKKLAVQWHAGKKEWTAYFWFEDEEIRNVFDRFYGAHPENKADLMLRIDPEKNHYELSLYRQGLREPQVIQERVYQLLVFRNKFECFRSENYDQERGAWIW